jgi:hypothetical protein
MNKAEAVTRMHRSAVNHVNLGALGYGHKKTKWDINKEPILAMGTDKMIPNYFINNSQCYFQMGVNGRQVSTTKKRRTNLIY